MSTSPWHRERQPAGDGRHVPRQPRPERRSAARASATATAVVTNAVSSPRRTQRSVSSSRPAVSRTVGSTFPGEKPHDITLPTGSTRPRKSTGAATSQGRHARAPVRATRGRARVAPPRTPPGARRSEANAREHDGDEDDERRARRDRAADVAVVVPLQEDLGGEHVHRRRAVRQEHAEQVGHREVGQGDDEHERRGRGDAGRTAGSTTACRAARGPPARSAASTRPAGRRRAPGRRAAPAPARAAPRGTRRRSRSSVPPARPSDARTWPTDVETPMAAKNGGEQERAREEHREGAGGPGTRRARAPPRSAGRAGATGPRPARRSCAGGPACATSAARRRSAPATSGRPRRPRGPRARARGSARRRGRRRARGCSARTPSARVTWPATRCVIPPSRVTS